ncbi:hypothetical protein [Pseudonocardia sp. NPDC049154]|uniref:hypothetical protein n=1 Tax=Pseudonocardia sp. NPDC049154 TaxID=3155501 RepID=UPI0033F3B66E
MAPGYTDPVTFEDGNPYGSSHVGRRAAAPVSETSRAAARFQGERVTRIAAALRCLDGEKAESRP